MNELIYLIPAIISPFIAIITVYLEYRKDQKEKLQDRKDFWLRQHYTDLHKELTRAQGDLSKHDDIPIYGTPFQITWTVQESSARPRYEIQNKLNILIEGDLTEHLKAYSFYENILQLQKRADEYRLKLVDLYGSIADKTNELVSKRLGDFRPVIDLPDDYEGYQLNQLINVLIDVQFLGDNLYVTTPFPIHSQDEPTAASPTGPERLTEKAGYYYTLADSSKHRGFVFSKDKKTIEVFKSDIVPELIKVITPAFDDLVREKRLIDDSLRDVAKGIEEIINNMNMGIRIDGECRTCKKVLRIKDLKNLELPS